MLAGSPPPNSRFLLWGRHAQVRAPHDDTHQDQGRVFEEDQANEKDDRFWLLIAIVVGAKKLA